MKQDVFSQNLDQLEPSFMYTHLFKEIFLEINYNEHYMKEFIRFWRDKYISKTSKLNFIVEFERDYRTEVSIL